jgi:hypothetical protein
MATRREALTQATVAALALCTPRSLLALADQLASDRFLIVALRDGSYLAIDSAAGRTVHRLVPNAVPDGEYGLSEQGSVIVRGGMVRGVRGQPRTEHYELAPTRGALLARRRDRRGVPAVRIATPRG